jgi:hypothetical protein
MIRTFQFSMIFTLVLGLLLCIKAIAQSDNNSKLQIDLYQPQGQESGYVVVYKQNLQDGIAVLPSGTDKDEGEIKEGLDEVKDALSWEMFKNTFKSIFKVVPIVYRKLMSLFPVGIGGGLNFEKKVHGFGALTVTPIQSSEVVHDVDKINSGIEDPMSWSRVKLSLSASMFQNTVFQFLSVLSRVRPNARISIVSEMPSVDSIDIKKDKIYKVAGKRFKDAVRQFKGLTIPFNAEKFIKEYPVRGSSISFFQLGGSEMALSATVFSTGLVHAGLGYYIMSQGALTTRFKNVSTNDEDQIVEVRVTQEDSNIKRGEASLYLAPVFDISRVSDKVSSVLGDGLQTLGDFTGNGDLSQANQTVKNSLKMLRVNILSEQFYFKNLRSYSFAYRYNLKHPLAQKAFNDAFRNNFILSGDLAVEYQITGDYKGVEKVDQIEYKKDTRDSLFAAGLHTLEIKDATDDDRIEPRFNQRPNHPANSILSFGVFKRKEDLEIVTANQNYIEVNGSKQIGARYFFGLFGQNTKTFKLKISNHDDQEDLKVEFIIVRNKKRINDKYRELFNFYTLSLFQASNQKLETISEDYLNSAVCGKNYSFQYEVTFNYKTLKVALSQNYDEFKRIVGKLKDNVLLSESHKVEKMDKKYISNEDNLKDFYVKLSKIINDADAIEDKSEKMGYLRDKLLKIKQYDLLLVYLVHFFPEAASKTNEKKYYFENFEPAYYVKMNLQSSKCNVNYLADYNGDELLERLLPGIPGNPGKLNVINRISLE